jgi:hypothetical protein
VWPSRGALLNFIDGFCELVLVPSAASAADRGTTRPTNFERLLWKAAAQVQWTFDVEGSEEALRTGSIVAGSQA